MHDFYSTSLLNTCFVLSDFSELSKNAQYRNTTSEGLVHGGK
jgi:hypothetical protein